MISPIAVLGADWKGGGGGERARVEAGDQSGGKCTDSLRDHDGWDDSGQWEWGEVIRFWIYLMMDEAQLDLWIV